MPRLDNTNVIGPKTDRIAILMAVHNGAEFLPAQLASFVDQSHENWHLLASVDGDSDGSRVVLSTHTEAGRTQILEGPKKGAGSNFMFLMQQADPEEYWALSDQDDVWLPDKLARAYQALAALPADQPAMYHTRTWVTNRALENPRLSDDRSGPSGFSNALAQNIVGGNTTLLNPAAARLINRAAQDAAHYVIHDWWLYQILSGVGANIVYDPEPSLYYRQHSGNVIGANLGWYAKVQRLKRVIDGTYQDWNASNAIALALSAHHFTKPNQAKLERFTEALNKPRWQRWRALRAIGLYRQEALSNLTMWAAVLLGRY